MIRLFKIFASLTRVGFFLAIRQYPLAVDRFISAVGNACPGANRVGVVVNIIGVMHEALSDAIRQDLKASDDPKARLSKIKEALSGANVEMKAAIINERGELREFGEDHSSVSDFEERLHENAKKKEPILN